MRVFFRRLRFILTVAWRERRARILVDDGGRYVERVPFRTVQRTIDGEPAPTGYCDECGRALFHGEGCRLHDPTGSRNWRY